MALLIPPPVLPGDCIRVISPAGPCDRTLLFRALGWLSTLYRVKWDRGIFSRTGYLAGSDDRRRVELEMALSEEDTQAIVATRGGYGTTRISHAVDFGQLRQFPKWLVGFSDITAMHLEIQRAGVCSLHGPNLAGLGRSDSASRHQWCHTLASLGESLSYAQLKPLVPGHATGPLIGGNLALLYDRAAAGRLALPEGCILFLEEVNEAPYQLDRMIRTLTAAGHLHPVAGVVLGELHGCRPLDEALQTVVNALGELHKPMVGAFPAGHGTNNAALPFGMTARLSASEGTLEILP